MIGDAYVYETLYYVDEDFKKIFKIKADFDAVMERNQETQAQYSTFIRKICHDEKLLPFDRSGVAAVIEYGVRLAGRQKKLSTEFHRITDILREANYWARKDRGERVTEKHVDQAIAEKIYRTRMIEDKIQEMIEDGIILIDSDGAKVGQVNGLSVYATGEYAFGKTLPDYGQDLHGQGRNHQHRAGGRPFGKHPQQGSAHPGGDTCGGNMPRTSL